MPRNTSGAEPDVTWGRSTVRTACPLDCPDSCTLDVTVENGRVVKIDGGHANPPTRGFICGKVRRFTDRLYGEDRLLYPAIRKGPKGQGVFERVTWDEALDHIARRMIEIRDTTGAEAILPFCYGGSNGLITQDTNDAALFRGLKTSRLARTVCAAPTGAASQGLYGKMPGVTYGDYVHARLIVLWGVNPSASGIHLVPYLKEAQKAGARLVVVDPRVTALARAGGSAHCAQAGHRSAPRPGASSIFVRGWFRGRGVSRRALPRCGRASEPRSRVDDRAGGGRCRHRAIRADPIRGDVPRCSSGADPLRMGPRTEPERRQRGSGNPGAAGGGREVRRARRWILDEQLRGAGNQGGGVVERHAGAANAPRQHEPPGSRTARVRRSAGRDAVRLQLQSAGDDARAEPRPARD